MGKHRDGHQHDSNSFEEGEVNDGRADSEAGSKGDKGEAKGSVNWDDMVAFIAEARERGAESHARDSEYAAEVSLKRLKRAMALRFCGDPAALEIVPDAVQEAFLELVTRPPNEPTFRWLVTVARNWVLQRLKRKRIHAAQAFDLDRLEADRVKKDTFAEGALTLAKKAGLTSAERTALAISLAPTKQAVEKKCKEHGWKPRQLQYMKHKALKKLRDFLLGGQAEFE